MGSGSNCGCSDNEDSCRAECDECCESEEEECQDDPDESEATPTPCDECAEIYYCDQTGCMSDTSEWWQNDECSWLCSTQDRFGYLTGEPGGSWSFTIFSSFPDFSTCEYSKSGGDCPDGSYTRETNICGDCAQNETLYA